MLTMLVSVVVALVVALVIACRLLCKARSERDTYRLMVRQECADKIAAMYESIRLRRQLETARGGAEARGR